MDVVIFASGQGSNAREILAAAGDGRLGGVKISAVVSDNPGAPALKIAESFGARAVYIDPMRKGARFSPEGEARYIDFIEKTKPDLIVLAGFMRILPEKFVENFSGIAINLHPSLLPAYKGKDAIKRAFEAGEKICGCTVHYISNELDGGEIIAQSRVEISPNDTLESLTEKVHSAERGLLLRVISDFSKK